MKNSTISYKRHRFPQQVIAHAVWLYLRFPLSLRLVEEMLLERGIVVSYERSADGVGNSDRPTSSNSVAGGRRSGTSGIWTRWWFRSRAESTGFGVPLIKTGTFSTSLFTADAIRRRPDACSLGC
ncbi:putative transposase [Rhizobium leguminosarum]|uniref:Transposase n=1 Tax=Rhizobium leguminosarum TaxID=384 RepID=A0AAE2MQN0_RHILE|nr:putative transposase [Rhizobium leguminosarum]MBB4436053.1 putative transposase [Rhizobium esperanzae]MBB4311845.1 putative transposase [Rhizobium leguminosarum]MBB4420879.1 putative transposase [Rhizobium leguminosarum]MBB4533088.1 putative transposase [Rhizobium leguminosarum]